MKFLSKIKTPIITFIITFSGLVFVFKNFGAIDRFHYLDSDSNISYTWSQIYSELPFFLCTSLVLTIFLLIVMGEQKKANKINRDAAIKRLEEKERLKKEAANRRKMSKGEE